MHYRSLLSALLLLLVLQAGAQQFGGFRPSVKWRQINTDTIRIIFTPGAEASAQRIASLVHGMAATENPLGNKLRKINLVLHSNTTLANGYVGLGPFRSEFYLVPGGNIFDFGNLPWAEQLAVHEYRHVQQYNNFNRGVSHIAGILFGQEGRALANAFTVPDWFWEGDAVYAETVLTPQGRGRMPYFLNGFHALWKEGRNYNWMKLRNGSLKDLVPNHYPLGYLLVNYGYLKYGPEFWGRVTRESSAWNRSLLTPFPSAVKHNSGIPFRRFRKDALNFYQHQVSRNREESGRRQTVIQEYYPRAAGTDSIVFVREGFKMLPAFYLRDTTGAHRIKGRAITSEDWISYQGGTIAYTRYRTHPRWSLTDFSDIVLLDVATKRSQTITRHKKYFTPALSPFDSTLVAVNINDSLQSELHFMDRSGNIVKIRRAPAGALFVNPAWESPQAVIVAIRQPNAKMTLHRLDLNTMKFEMLLPPTFSTIGNFEVANGTVYFSSSLEGQDEIYALNLADRSTWKVVEGGSGNYFPAIAGKKIWWSQFTSNGFRLRSADTDSLVRNHLEPTQWMDANGPYRVANSDSARALLSMETRSYPVSKYRKGTGLFNFHSYRPYYEDPELTVTLYGNNVLNTFTSQLFYRYNTAENAHAAGFDVAYGGWFPVLTAGVEHTFDRTVYTRTTKLNVRQTEIKGGYYIPLNFTGGRTYKLLDFGSDLVYNQTAPLGNTKNILRAFSTTYMRHFISWNQQLPRARQHIYPKLGYNVSNAFRHRLDERGYQANTAGNIYLPSIARTHSIVLNAGFQLTDTGNVLFSNRFSNARGYPDLYYAKMWKLGANYHFPVIYPDKGVLNLVYLLRVRANVFHDYNRNYFKDGTRFVDLRSSGAELFFDTKLGNALPITFQFRYSYLHDAAKAGRSNPNVFEFIIPVNPIPR